MPEVTAWNDVPLTMPLWPPGERPVVWFAPASAPLPTSARDPLPPEYTEVGFLWEEPLFAWGRVSDRILTCRWEPGTPPRADGGRWVRLVIDFPAVLEPVYERVAVCRAQSVGDDRYGGNWSSRYLMVDEPETGIVVHLWPRVLPDATVGAVSGG